MKGNLVHPSIRSIAIIKARRRSVCSPIYTWLGPQKNARLDRYMKAAQHKLAASPRAKSRQYSNPEAKSLRLSTLIGST